MNKAVRYIHALEQIAGELRDEADEMERLLDRLRRQRIANTPRVELRAQYDEYLKVSGTRDAIGRLNTLTESMKNDEELMPEHSLEGDMIAANRHALRLCNAMFNIARITVGD
jgi:hypothetical protein